MENKKLALYDYENEVTVLANSILPLLNYVDSFKLVDFDIIDNETGEVLVCPMDGHTYVSMAVWEVA